MALSLTCLSINLYSLTDWSQSWFGLQQPLPCWENQGSYLFLMHTYFLNTRFMYLLPTSTRIYLRNFKLIMSKDELTIFFLKATSCIVFPCKLVGSIIYLNVSGIPPTFFLSVLKESRASFLYLLTSAPCPTPLSIAGSPPPFLAISYRLVSFPASLPVSSLFTLLLLIFFF